MLSVGSTYGYVIAVSKGVRQSFFSYKVINGALKCWYLVSNAKGNYAELVESAISLKSSVFLSLFWRGTWWYAFLTLKALLTL